MDKIKKSEAVSDKIYFDADDKLIYPKMYISEIMTAVGVNFLGNSLNGLTFSFEDLFVLIEYPNYITISQVTTFKEQTYLQFWHLISGGVYISDERRGLLSAMNIEVGYNIFHNIGLTTHFKLTIEIPEYNRKMHYYNKDNIKKDWNHLNYMALKWEKYVYDNILNK